LTPTGTMTTMSTENVTQSSQSSSDNTGPPAGETLAISRTLRRRAIDLLVLMPIIGVVLASIQVYSFARGDAVTFRFLIQTMDVRAILSATLVPVFLVYALMVPFGIAFAAIKKPTKAEIREFLEDDRRRAKGLTTAGFSFVFVVVIVLVTPVSTAIAAIAFSGYWAFHFRKARRSRGDSLKDALLQIPLTTLLLPMILSGALISMAGTPWLPAETARIGPSKSAIHFYALKVEGDNITILNMDSTKVHTVAIGDLNERQACNDGSGASWFSKPIRSLLLSARQREEMGIISHARCPGA
jgi:hypothetical protein